MCCVLVCQLTPVLSFGQHICSPQYAVAGNQRITHRPLPVPQRAVYSVQCNMSALRLKTGLYEKKFIIMCDSIQYATPINGIYVYSDRAVGTINTATDRCT